MSPHLDPVDVLDGHRVVPVVVLDDPARADALGAALVEGGLPVAEATFRTPEAAAVLRQLARRDDLVVGAGTVLTERQVDEALDAGARFIVSPGLSAVVVRRCQEAGVPVIPGISTPTEIMQALDLGLDTVKFFPAEANGGLPTIKALAAAFPQVRFMPTGGITVDSAPAYLAHPSVVAVGGSWMVAADLLAAGRWDEVAARCAATAALSTSQRAPIREGAPA
ncbi:2-dehydro-3-deoxyphosphogluconate aldolase / (4S)-4-hydroxy-2-oxoglutarate aldolase [Nocardioides alpinus]|uniref:2-dehydro-3-deoxyphosphogluconate aldolase / (4S)-4-hydroxy-2-oxoglutarate aldolase n=1 Tax=Nocardioides alpinus TaxID=748909 RepID=A0A1I0Y6V3_9ACTN|nr:bifunctional 4-hydroxy-2-oxoglutarate aldolase/2-dehydro-3-deoxy-phosphogluconate aldolase [Nocardioides alpinus]PKH39016.1 keto-deoxy-phosphogluconate aldolase [Nocardioides alpinus]SFB09039.1 2-dehydro-3-deoxyphosphogluconate aldolase / (4S)-4-hydroxy-2-oxoglutarate aldolase [Nocardioides alpinus]